MSELTHDAIAGICDHMNDDHAEAIARYATTFGGVADARSARIAALDPNGMDLAVETASGMRNVRVTFDHTLADAADARETLIAMARRGAPTT